MSSMNTNETLVREFYQQYQARNKGAFAALMHEDFEFSSPYDDHINTAQYFERCWGGGDIFKNFTIEKIAVNNQYVFVQTSFDKTNGEPSVHDVEVFTIEDDKVREVQVFFGDQAPMQEVVKRAA